MGLTLVGFVLVVPLFLPGLLRALRPLLARWRSAEGRMAFRRLDRRRVRTALTVGVLFMAVAVGIGVGNSILSSVRDVGDWYERTLTADFYVRAAMPDTGTATTAQVPETVGEALARIDGVRHVSRLRFLPARTQGHPIMVLALDFHPSMPLSLDVASGDRAAVLRGLVAGDVVLATVLARRFGLGVGDSIALETPSGARPFRVAGTVTEYTVGGAVVYMDYEAARRALGFTGVDVYLVRARPETRERVGAETAAVAAANACIFQTNADLRVAVDRMMDGVVGLLWALLALVFFVAALGVVNTMTMSVLEQTRELGVLRSVGLTRGQALRLVLAEAASLGFLSVVPGAVGGLLMALLFGLAQYPLTGHPVDVAIDGTLVAGCLLVAVLTAVAAALPAALRAARLRVVEALQYE
jgi:putative ABC transport system permease protein